MASSSSSSSSSSSGFSSLKLSVALMVLVLLSLSTTTTAQAECASKLTPCASYIKTNDTPSETCCSSIKDAVTNQLKCLCALYQDPTVFASLNFTTAEALGLARRCGVTTDLSNCAAEAPTATPPPPASGNDGIKMAWMVLWSFILIWASMMFF